MPPSPRPRRNPVSRAVLVLVGTAMLYAAGWFAFAAQVRSAAEAWLARHSDHPVRLSCPDLTVAGFPGPVVVTCAAPRGRTPDWSWSGPAVRVTVAPWALEAWPFDAPGVHRFDGPDGPVDVQAMSLEGVIDPAGAVTLRMSDGAVTHAGSMWRIEAAEGRLTADPDADPPVAARLRAEASGVDPPPDIAAQMRVGTRFDRLAADVDVEGAFDASGWPPRAAALAAWRDAGGVVQVRAARAEIGDVSLDADGTMALDALLQPQAAFTVRLGGFDAAVGALVAGGVLDARRAAMVRFVLGALAEVPEGGGRKIVSAPLTVQDGGVFLGPIEVGRLRPVRWPE
jgi:hypothetical protein